MDLAFFVPLALVASAIVAVTPIAPRLRPQLGTWCLTGLAAAGLLASSGVAVAIIASGLPGGAELAARYGWCRRLVGHGSWPQATAAAFLGALAVVNVLRVLWRERRELSGLTGGAGVKVVDVPAVGAVAVPGRPGSIVVTTGLLALLSVDERKAMFAHERAHLDLHHHRYVRLVRTAAAAVPLLRPLVKRVRFTTERWADEHAARELGDRSSVARALARAALDGETGTPMPLMAAATLGVDARVRALGTAPRASLWEPLALVVVMAAVVGAATQYHHLATLLLHICA